MKRTKQVGLCNWIYGRITYLLAIVSFPCGWIYLLGMPGFGITAPLVPYANAAMQSVLSAWVLFMAASLIEDKIYDGSLASGLRKLLGIGG